jgi:hypothetical protein
MLPISSSPNRTSAVYLLLGALPIEAELHKRQLSLLYSILASKLKNLMERQLTVNKNNPESFFFENTRYTGLVQLTTNLCAC